ncbi:Glycosyl transferases group 1 [Paenibacillus sp. 1_12]|uniref:glycosyltransferase n=1 Tax=Paenibacillus sp. 1_12 TaxID=1566278 RepID=UPI0008EEFBCD|nr:glycosyltransferase [Paenibacillus sp. 1_12]SFL16031.1 Glycosyl transferases group 1 [Paenibacillus sp. 1_12]
MKKRLLFIINNLDCGGAEKALISLLETIDYASYEVDLFLFKHHGLFFNSIPKQVRLLAEPTHYKYFDMSIKKVFVECLKKGKLNIALSRACAGYIFKNERNRAVCDQRVWTYIARTLQGIDNQYDAAIAYLEKNPIYFCIDKVHAVKKIGFIHNDYDKLGMDPKLDLVYFTQLDHLVTVSEQCAVVLKQRFPELENKIEVMHNIVSPPIIHNLASIEMDDCKTSGVKLISVGRLVYQKGFDLAIEACKDLIQNGYPVTWYVIGEGEDRSKLEQLIADHKLQQSFILLGTRENPYPYIKEADIYVQPSRFEGKSIALDEAKILHKPIVVTNYSTVNDQITHEFNGLIVDMDAAAVAEGIKRLLDLPELKYKLTANLSQEKQGTESEINKLYALVE